MASNRAELSAKIYGELLGWKDKEDLKAVFDQFALENSTFLADSYLSFLTFLTNAYDTKSYDRRTIQPTLDAILFRLTIAGKDKDQLNAIYEYFDSVIEGNLAEVDKLKAATPVPEDETVSTEKPKTKETEKKESFRLSKALLAKRLNISMEVLDKMEEPELLDLVWVLVLHQSNIDIIEKSPTFAQIDFHTKKFNDLFTNQGTSYDLATILKEFTNGDTLMSKVNVFAWANNVGHEKSKLSNPEEKDGLKTYTKAKEMAPEHFRISMLLGLSNKPLIVPNEQKLEEKQVIQEKPLRAPISMGEIIRQCIRWTLEQKMNKKSGINPFARQDQWRAALTEFLINQMATTDAERKAYRESTLIGILPTLVYNLLEGLLFRSKFDTSALKADGSFSEFVNFGESRGKLVKESAMPIAGGATIPGTPKLGSTGDFDFNIESYVSLYTIPAEKYQLGFNVVPSEALMTPEEREILIKNRGVLSSDPDHLVLTDRIRNYMNQNKERAISDAEFLDIISGTKSLIQWILDDRVDSQDIPVYSKQREFSVGNIGEGVFGWPSSYIASEIKVVIDSYGMADIAKKGILGHSWLKLPSKEKRSNGSEYVTLNGAEASKANGLWRSGFYYWVNDNTWQVSKNEYDQLRKVWFSDKKDKDDVLTQAQLQGKPFPLRAYKRTPDGQLILDDNGQPKVEYKVTMVPTNLYKFRSKEDLDHLLAKKEIDGYQYDLLLSQWMRITSDDTADQLNELIKCIYETQVVSELIEISEDEWDGDHTRAFMDLMSFEYWYFSTRTLTESFQDMSKSLNVTNLNVTDLNGKKITDRKMAGKLDLVRAFIEAKRSSRVPIQEVFEMFGLKLTRFFPTVEDRRYEGLGQWTRSEATMILRAARKDTLQKKKKTK